MSIKINGTDVIDDNSKGIFQSANVGSFSNPQRPGSASTGDLIWSTTDNELQTWNGSSWVKATGDGVTISASGGTPFTPGNGYKLHVFTSPGTFTLSSPTAKVEYAVVAGGGGGGMGSRVPNFGPAFGGGGGAGGFVIGSATWSSGNYTITIGNGGAGIPAPNAPIVAPGNTAVPGSNGSPSSISGPSGTYTATGGGAGAGSGNGNPGGSGGGAALPSGPNPLTAYGGTADLSQGNQGGGTRVFGSGGGGGAHEGSPYNVVAPQHPLSILEANSTFWGGSGYPLDWGIPSSYGTSVQPLSLPRRNQGRFFAGGGGDPRTGGGGGGQPSPSIPGPIDGTANTGGGGAQGRPSPQGNSVPTIPAIVASGNGGSGIVIIRYQEVQ